MRTRAFTLIELLVVIAVISLLSSVVLASLNTARDKARVAAGKSLSAQIDHIAGDYSSGFWEFDECSGSTTMNRIAAVSSAISGAFSWLSDSPKAIGCSISFDSSAYVNVPNPSDQTQSYSYSFWIKARTVQLSGLISNSPISPPISGANGNNSNIYLNANGTIGYFVFNGSSYIITTTSAIATGKWYHVAVTQDVTGAKRAIYLNGSKEAEDIYASTQNFGRILINFNRTESGYFPGPNAFFDGQMDEVHFYAKALTAEEVGGIYAAGASEHGLARR